MGRQYARRLVIDADVARAAGGKDSVHPTGQRCRDFLISVRGNGLVLVMTPEIHEEWSKHESSFSRKWRRWMVGGKQYVYVKPTAPGVPLNRLQSDRFTKNQMAAMAKDRRLVEAAIETDDTVASSDNIVRELFTWACDQVEELREIVWVNPDKPEEEPIAWLELGAPADKRRKLGWKA